MPRILVFNGTPSDGEARIVNAGSKSYDRLIRESLSQHAKDRPPLEYYTLRVADGERFPQGMSVGDFDGVWISGSPYNAYQLDQPSVKDQIELTREIWDNGIPAFGSCWGLQVMTAALGGKVQLNPRGREIGIARNIFQTEAGREHAMYRDKSPAFDAVCVHEDEVAELPACGTLLASNDMSRVQAAVMREGERCFWGVQYHPEFELATVAAIIAMRASRHISEGLARSEDELAGVLADYRALSADPQRTDLAWKHGVGADVLAPARRTLEFRNWVDAEVLPFAAKRDRT
jgi:GMP synthase (glutamine-hydrolysing)